MLQDPRMIFGIHSVTPYNRETGEFYGALKVLDNSSIAITSELISLTGGSQKFPWAVENGPSTAEISLSVSQYDDFLLELAYGATASSNAAEVGGSVTAITNRKGTLVEAATGIDSIAIVGGSETDLKFGKYVIKAVSTTEVDVFASSDVDFSRGTSAVFEDGLLKINSSPITIPDSSATVAITDFGLEIVGGTGTIALVAGDTASFEVRPPNKKSMDIVIGGAEAVVPEVGLMIYSEKRGTSEMFEIDVYRAKLTGLPFGFTKSEWSTAEVTAQAYYDSKRNGVLALRSITP